MKKKNTFKTKSKSKKKKRLFIGQVYAAYQNDLLTLKNLITRLITTLFKVFGLLVDPYNR